MWMFQLLMVPLLNWLVDILELLGHHFWRWSYFLVSFPNLSIASEVWILCPFCMLFKDMVMVVNAIFIHLWCFFSRLQFQALKSLQKMGNWYFLQQVGQLYFSYSMYSIHCWCQTQVSLSNTNVTCHYQIKKLLKFKFIIWCICSSFAVSYNQSAPYFCISCFTMIQHKFLYAFKIHVRWDTVGNLTAINPRLHCFSGDKSLYEMTAPLFDIMGKVVFLFLYMLLI